VKHRIEGWDEADEAKRRVEDLFWRINVDRLAKLGAFSQPGIRSVMRWGNLDGVGLCMRIGICFTRYYSEGLALRIDNGAVIKLATTRTHFDGSRWVFLCPGCNRRVRILYADSPSHPFRCRACLDLCYRSQLNYPKNLSDQESAWERDSFPDSPFPLPLRLTGCRGQAENWKPAPMSNARSIRN
jgi:hypothetical protein